MHITTAISVAILGFSAVSVAFPLEHALTRRTPQGKPICGILDNFVDRDCVDEEDLKSPPKGSGSPWGSWGGAQQPRPQQPASPPWGSSPRPSYPQQAPQQGSPFGGWTGQPASNSPYQPAPRPNGPNQGAPYQGAPRPAAPAQPAAAPPASYDGATGSGSWCNRPDPARRPASCNQQAQTAAPVGKPKQGGRGNRGDQ